MNLHKKKLRKNPSKSENLCDNRKKICHKNLQNEVCAFSDVRHLHFQCCSMMSENIFTPVLTDFVLMTVITPFKEPA